MCTYGGAARRSRGGRRPGSSRVAAPSHRMSSVARRRFVGELAAPGAGCGSLSGKPGVARSRASTASDRWVTFGSAERAWVTSGSLGSAWRGSVEPERNAFVRFVRVQERARIRGHRNSYCGRIATRVVAFMSAPEFEGIQTHGRGREARPTPLSGARPYRHSAGSRPSPWGDHPEPEGRGSVARQLPQQRGRVPRRQLWGAGLPKAVTALMYTLAPGLLLAPAHPESKGIVERSRPGPPIRRGGPGPDATHAAGAAGATTCASKATTDRRNRP